MTGLIVTLVKLISGANVRWTGCSPTARQRVYFANHTSHLDAAVIWASLPTEVRALTRPVAARDYWVKGKLRPYLATKVFNAVLIEREKVSAHDNPLDRLDEALGRDHSLIIFPEGSRSLTGEIGAFKSGIYHLAKRRPDVEFVPVLIDNLSRILPKGEFLAVPLLSSVSFGTPMQLKIDETKQAFLERARSAVMNLRNA
ncbi:Phospholipid/glycerol acyltransferase [Verrucomicrobia bacterium]|nr:Phospholipid/glycerol acyltransferase [Verrucomicrobiota bacterium]